LSIFAFPPLSEPQFFFKEETRVISGVFGEPAAYADRKLSIESFGSVWSVALAAKNEELLPFCLRQSVRNIEAL
jgi:hypothetical protein